MLHFLQLALVVKKKYKFLFSKMHPILYSNAGFLFWSFGLERRDLSITFASLLTQYMENYFLTANKETAFVYALTSAAVVHSVTKSCTAGDLPDCACTKSDLKYYGKRWKARCDENIQYGILFSELFVDAPDQEKQARLKNRRSAGQYLVNLHNSRAGRKVSNFFY